MKAPTTQNPFRDFADGIELDLRGTRAKLFALHVLTETGKDPGEETLDAVCHLIAEALQATDRMIEMHGQAFIAFKRAST